MDKKHDIETLMGHLGEFGKYQFFQFFLHILGAVPAGLHMVALAVLAATPDHRCKVPGIIEFYNQTEEVLDQFIPKNALGVYDSCSIIGANNTSIPCNSWVYDDTYYKDSRVIDWDLVCDKKWLASLSQMIFMLGVLVGAVTLGMLADKFGRKKIYYISALFQLLFGISSAYIPEFYTFLVIRFCLGLFGCAGPYLAGFVLTMELVGESKRTACGITFQGAFALGIMLVAFWGYFIPNRFYLEILYGLHALIFIGQWWLLDESPRWLYANGKVSEAVRIVKKALKFNNVDVEIDESNYVAQAKMDKPTSVKEEGLADIFKSKVMLIRTLNVALCWFANSLAYYGLSLNAGKLSGNPFLMMFVMGIIEWPGYVITIYILDIVGRRAMTSFPMIIGGALCVFSPMMTMTILTIAFAITGKFFVAISFAVIYNYTAELYPTVVRNSALGFGTMCARISGAMTPMISLLDTLNPIIPSVIFGLIGVVSGFLVFFLPETLGKKMPDTIEDGEKFGKGDTFFKTGIPMKKKKENEENVEQLRPLK